jgi:phosphate transport system permease protein
LYLMGLVMLIAVPIGVLTAVYISEYQSKSRFANILRVVVNNLAGVPSIVYGLLGLGMLVLYFGWGFSLLASAVTLAFLVLPLVITASREAIQAVPSSLREASLALGTTKWQTIRHHVLPYSLPGVLTGVILSVSRAAGETAPILFTGVVALKAVLPDSVLDSFMAMPFQLYFLSTQTRYEVTHDFQYGTALVLLIMIVLMNLAAIVIRNRYREKYRW